MKVKWKIAKSGQGERTPSRFKLCDECKIPLTKFRFELYEAAEILNLPAEPYVRTNICPKCVLMAYLNKANWFERLFRLKPVYKSSDIVEK